jgi:hypothetical protein
MAVVLLVLLLIKIMIHNVPRICKTHTLVTKGLGQMEGASVPSHLCWIARLIDNNNNSHVLPVQGLG